MSQALAALGMPASAVYARRPEPTPPAARVTQAPAPKAAVSRLPAPVPAKPDTPAQPVTPKVSAGQLAAKPPAPTPVRLLPTSARGPEARPGSVVPKGPCGRSAGASRPTPPAAPNPVAARAEPQLPVASRQASEQPGPAGPEQPPSALVRGRRPSPHPTTPLTAAELVDTAIEVRNGTWTKDLARQTRSRLCQEGFTVAMIGNHVDFGATKTIIYYRPGAERVARTVGRTVFPQAALEPSLKLKKGMDIKILLGADLLERPQLMARLVAGDI